jgi:hypothetical protein
LVKSSLTLAAVKASDLNFINLYTDTWTLVQSKAIPVTGREGP